LYVKLGSAKDKIPKVEGGSYSPDQPIAVGFCPTSSNLSFTNSWDLSGGGMVGMVTDFFQKAASAAKGMKQFGQITDAINAQTKGTPPKDGMAKVMYDTFSLAAKGIDKAKGIGMDAANTAAEVLLGAKTDAEKSAAAKLVNDMVKELGNYDKKIKTAGEFIKEYGGTTVSLPSTITIPFLQSRLSQPSTLFRAFSLIRYLSARFDYAAVVPGSGADPFVTMYSPSGYQSDPVLFKDQWVDGTFAIRSTNSGKLVRNFLPADVSIDYSNVNVVTKDMIRTPLYINLTITFVPMGMFDTNDIARAFGRADFSSAMVPDGTVSKISRDALNGKDTKAAVITAKSDANSAFTVISSARPGS